MSSADQAHRDSFETTHWSVVLAAGQDKDADRARAALEALCRAYWFPLFAFARRHGHGTADAQDLVQGFFVRILERRDLQAVRRERGRFRSYLLTAFKNYIANQTERAGAAKRGGGRLPIPLDELIRERPHRALPADTRSPDCVFDQQWALAMLERVFAQLRQEHDLEGRRNVFDRLQGFLGGERDTGSQAEIATELQMTEGAVKQAVFRLRQRYQKLLRAEVAQTVATLADVDGELRHLVAALRG